ncbi:MAG: sulfite exporter TauE/SafE family protein [Pseudotabrizicola sp.]|uniref:sulfite exporter TauE/SafE family protein n=1 Tax=Pseudotabrizicola sp. TaxID=2939647 RepID=UPI0027284BA6|nr:sulfite exporter TauE/SafE family protein [Pseudotabrizicola sp.]MDO8883416.1 sulfite exporter TauE/SafE family protein [Pseudotabrizicola sp.]MDP2082343.1 sulfite exporter TauE/SafE family protein [Pseudotabrizicola sp.]MDZ7574331.1 sulfite exporter TauE/SafE family protein [Pseudotabrizicola sp.]
MIENAVLYVSVDQGFWPLTAAVVVTLLAGFVKGAVGFAMPLIMISAFSAFLPPEVALAGLILPTLVTNLSQAFRQGFGPAKTTAWQFRRFLIGTVVFIAIAAQFFDHIPRVAYLLLLGVPVTAFAALQLAGVPLALRLEHRSRAEWGLGVIGGLYGGVSGIWGPPLLVYLLSINASKLDAVRAQGVVFLIGAVALLAAHLGTGLANAHTMAFSAALIVPAQLGMVLGYRLQDRLPQARFRRWTQALLVVTGLNLIVQALVA